MSKMMVASALLCVAAAGCGSKKGADIKTVCEDNFAHGEMNNDKWTPGKGDPAKFMEYCLAQSPDVVRCSSMTIDFGDKSCEKHTGISTDGFKVKIELGKLRNGEVAPPPPAADTTTVVTAAKLDAIVLPRPTLDAPATAAWAAQESTKDGSRLAYFGEGKDSWMGLQIIDCNLPRMKEDAAKPAGERWADAGYCLDELTAKLQSYPLYDKYDTVRGVRVGHLAVIASVAPKTGDTLKPADLEAYLGTLDLAAIAKL